MKGKILAIIPARGGSKEIPGKNIKELNGKPLMAYTIEEALKCPEIDRVVVSTDSKEIAQVAEKYGAEVPFMRPAQLAADTSKTIDAVWDVLDRLEEAGYLRTNAQHFTLEPTAAANGVLFGGEKVAMSRRRRAERKNAAGRVRRHPPRRPARTVSSRRSRRSARASPRRRACLPMLYSPTRRSRTWRQKLRTRWRIFWRSPASAR